MKWDAQGIVNLIVALGGVTGALATGYVAWRRLKPANTNLQITNADTLVDIAVEAAAIVKTQRDEFAAEVRELRASLADVVPRLEKAERQVLACADAVSMERAAKNAMYERADELQKRVLHLEAEVERLTERYNPRQPHDPI